MTHAPYIIAMPVLLTMASLAHGQPADPVVAAAVKRQELLKSVDVTFKRVDTEAVGSRSYLWKGAKSKLPVPAQETVSESMNRLVLDGRKVRFENGHWSFFLANGQLQMFSRTSAWNGAVAKSMDLKGLNGKETPSGRIERKFQREDFAELLFEPFHLAFGGTESDCCRHRLAEMLPTGTKQVIDGAMCVEYVVSGHSYWFDTTRGYSLRRVVHQRNNTTLRLIDIRNRLDESGCWLPQSWVQQRFFDTGEALSTSKIEVATISVNKPVDATLFELPFPPGCHVFEEATNKEYLVQPDGSLGEYQPPLRSPEDEEKLRQVRWLQLLLVMPLAVLAGLGFWRWRKIRRAK